MKKKDVFISAVNYQLPKRFEEILLFSPNKQKIIVGGLDVDKKNKYYPARSDEKIMRTDVIASIISISNLLEKLELTEEDKLDMSLFVANSIFIEESNKNMKRAFSVLNRIKEFGTVEQKLATIYKNVPPLLALETLTNATMSFISQYTGIKGNNTTFGSTSHSGFDALEEAFLQIENNQTEKALVGGSNCSGIYSFLTYQNFYKNTDGWKESACSSFLVLGDSGDVKITKIDHNFIKLSIKGLRKNRMWGDFFRDKSPEFIVYSGGFIQDDFVQNEKEVKSICNDFFSWEREYGNLGSASLFMGIAHGYNLIKSGRNKTVDILNRDVYGRESHIRIEKVIR